MWRVPEKKRRQLNGDEIFTMHAVIKQGARVFFPISLVLQSTIKITGDLKHQKPVRIRRPQVLWTKHCHTCRPSLLDQTSVRYTEINARPKTNGLGCCSSQTEEKFLSRVELPADCQCENIDE